MDSLKGLLRNKNAKLTSALLIGLFWGKAARRTEAMTLPALAIVMILSTIGLPASTFLLGRGMEKAGVFFHSPEKVLTRLVLLGSLKNYGLAGGRALALFSKKPRSQRRSRPFS